MILVPRARFELLLKQVEEKQQSGGQIMSKQSSTDEPQTEKSQTEKSQDSPSLERTVQPEHNNQQSTNDDSQEQPTLFVEKPLSEMKFRSVTRRRAVTKKHTKKATTSKKRPWIDYKF